MARTATRPIPSGQITPRQALVFLALELLAGLLVLIQLNGFAILLGLAALPLVFAYPFMKRFTYWPQAWLGLTFNWGALMGWAAVTGGLAWPPVLLYAAGLCWTLGYDTIYAHQDKEDDALIGVKSTALKLGARTRPWLAGFYGATVALLAAAGLRGRARLALPAGGRGGRRPLRLADLRPRHGRPQGLPAALQVEPLRRLDPAGRPAGRIGAGPCRRRLRQWL